MLHLHSTLGQAGGPRLPWGFHSMWHQDYGRVILTGRECWTLWGWWSCVMYAETLGPGAKVDSGHISGYPLCPFHPSPILHLAEFMQRCRECDVVMMNNNFLTLLNNSHYFKEWAGFQSERKTEGTLLSWSSCDNPDPRNPLHLIWGFIPAPNRLQRDPRWWGLLPPPRWLFLSLRFPGFPFFSFDR